MTSDTEYGRDPLGQALAVPVEPVARLDPSGFDPSRERPFWMTPRTITHREARDAASRLINSHFRNADKECARVSIPANPDRDDDLLIMGYIWQQEAIATEARRAETLGSVHEGAGLQGIAQPQSVSGLSHTGGDRG